MRVKVRVVSFSVCLSVCLPTSDFEDPVISSYTRNGHENELCNIVSSLNVAFLKIKAFSEKM